MNWMYTVYSIICQSSFSAFVYFGPDEDNPQYNQVYQILYLRDEFLPVYVGQHSDMLALSLYYDYQLVADFFRNFGQKLESMGSPRNWRDSGVQIRQFEYQMPSSIDSKQTNTCDVIVSYVLNLALTSGL